MMYEDRYLAPYYGDEPFIFLSYSHKDAEAAAGIIRGLKDRHFRVWYDEGLTPGASWTESIAVHIKQCSCLIALVTDAYINSKICKAELNYAFSNNKPRVLVYLEQVSLPDDLAFLHNDAHALHTWDYPHAREKLFYDKLFLELNLCDMG